MEHKEFGVVAVCWGNDTLWNMNLFWEMEEDK